MNAPRHDDLKEIYEIFTQDHDRLRESMMASLRTLPPTHKQLPWTHAIPGRIGATILRKKMTRLVAAAMIAMVIILGVRTTNGARAWADVVKALSDVNDIHTVSKRIYLKSGTVEESEWWLKDGKKSRDEIRSRDGSWTFLEDGTRRLRLSHRDRTAEFHDSEPDEPKCWGLLEVLRGTDRSYSAKVKLLGETDDGLKIYEVRRSLPEERCTIIDTAWVDPRTDLPVRTTYQVVDSGTGEVRIKGEETCDYDPIPWELFELVVPAGYTDITDLQTEVLSGTVVDEAGQPVDGAEVLISDSDMKGRTNDEGAFSFRQPASKPFGGFPMIVRAIRPGDPSHVAWTLLRNPRHELRPLRRPDDGKSKLEEGGGVVIVLLEEQALRAFIPPDPGTMAFKGQDDSCPSKVTNMLLTMRPASVITGRITNRAGHPIANAVVRLNQIEVAVGENDITIITLGRTDRERAILSSLSPGDSREVGARVFAVTDEDGCYTLGNLPNVWHRARLEARADGYVQISKTILHDEGNDFTLIEADITVRGTVIDNHGVPLVGRKVEIDVESKDDEEADFGVDDVIIDAQGRFEFTGLPAVKGLQVQVRADEKPYDWSENELTRGRPFIYYLMIEYPIVLEPEKREYSIEIVASRPDITLEIEVKDKEDNPLAGVPVGVCSPGFSEREWYIRELVGRTDSRGVCIINGVPRISPLRLWFCVPDPRTFQDWESMPELSGELKTAIRECRSKYAPSIVTVEAQKDKKNYAVFVRL